MDKYHIFTGHYGSGKTEISINAAMKSAAAGLKTVLVDMDIVNPYFRAADAKKELEKAGVKVIASDFANSNLDIPTIPSDVKSVFDNEYDMVIFDMGGDDDGARAIGMYRHFLRDREYRMYMVVNTKRPLSDSAGSLMEYKISIENASGLKFTDIVNNTNLGKQTTAETMLDGINEIKKFSETAQIDRIITTGTKETLDGIDKLIGSVKEIKIYIRKPWEQDPDKEIH